jgi:hypothetical protein
MKKRDPTVAKNGMEEKERQEKGEACFSESHVFVFSDNRDC